MRFSLVAIAIFVGLAAASPVAVAQPEAEANADASADAAPEAAPEAAAAAQAGPPQFVGKAIVQNRCPFPVTLWSVGQSIGPANTLSAYTGSYTETYRTDPVTGGRALKITRKSDGLFNSSPQTVFAYNLDGAKVWYDLSHVFGNPFGNYKLRVASTDGTCPSIYWNGQNPPTGSQVKVCGSTKTIVLTLCY